MTRRNPEVDAFLDGKAHPLRPAIDHLRDVLLAADPRLAESVKWGGPTYTFAGSKANLATITLRGKKALTLFFQEGASLPDPHGLLQGDAAHVRTARFATVGDIDAATPALIELARAFCDANAG